jgi:hypothetical protein
VERPHRDVRARQRRHRDVGAELCEPEVRHLHAVLADEDVRRQIAMHDAGGTAAATLSAT